MNLLNAIKKWLNPPPNVKLTGRAIDFTSKGWGHDCYYLCAYREVNGVRQWRFSGWSDPPLRKGDVFKINEEQSYVAHDVYYPGDPQDMWFAWGELLEQYQRRNQLQKE